MHLSTSRLAATFAAGAFLVVTGGDANGGVDAETGLKASVRGTIAPSGETETFRFDAPTGAIVSLTATSKTKGALDLALALEAPSGGTVALDGASRFNDTGSKVTVQRLTLPESGVYTLRLAAVGTGEYTLALTVTPKTRYTGRPLVTAGGTAALPFAAPAGARLSLSAKASKRSPAQPRFGFLGATDLSALGQVKKSSHTVSVAALGATADYEVQLNNLGAKDGSIDVTVVVLPAKVKTRTLDVRGVDGAEAAVVRLIDASSGGTIEVESATSPLGGCLLMVPPGALGADRTITVRSSRPVPVADPATQQRAGPVATFGPSGTTFASPVTIRLPYDPSAFPQGSDPVTDLRVVRREANGATTTLVPTAVFPAEAMYEFETSGFSDFAPVAPQGPPNLDGRTYWALRFAQVHEFSLTDSRRREVRVRTGVATLSAAHTFTFQGEERAVVMNNTGSVAGQIQGTVQASTAPATASGGWQYFVGEPTLTKVTIGDDKLSMRTDGAVLCGSVIESFDPAPDLHLYAQKPPFPLTTDDVLATYWLGRISIAPAAAAGKPAEITYTDAFGTLELRAGGACRWIRHEDTWHWDLAAGTRVEASNHRTYNGTFSIAGPSAGVFEGAVDVQVAGFSWRLLPDRTADILFGTDPAPADAMASVIVATRASKNMPITAIDGTFVEYGLRNGFEIYRIDGEVVPDWSSGNGYQTRWWHGDLWYRYTPHLGYSMVRTQEGGLIAYGSGSIRVETAWVNYTTTGRYQIYQYTSGDLISSTDLVGGITPDAAFGFAVSNPAGDYGPEALVHLFVRTGP